MKTPILALAGISLLAGTAAQSCAGVDWQVSDVGFSQHIADAEQGGGAFKAGAVADAGRHRVDRKIGNAV